jgi:antitoxin component YwqK of YwqJK toxin-antitoxin module
LLRKDYATPYNGTCVSCFPSFTIEEKLNFVNGRRQGTDTSFYQSGCLQSIQSYQIGLQDGPTYVFYDSTNRVQFEIWYLAGQLHGPSIQYSRNATSDTLTYKNYKNGKLDGEYVELFMDGKKKIYSFYVDGNLQGISMEYFRNGNKSSMTRYKNGVKHGYATGYDENGKEVKTIYYYKGRLLTGKDLDKHLNYCKSKGIDPNE